jgi:hypothetical protein
VSGSSSGAASRRGDHHEVAALAQDASAELGGQLVGDEDAFEHLPTGPIPEDALVPALGLLVHLQPARDDHQLGCDPPGLGQEADSIVLLEMAVEVAREQAIERLRPERQGERIALDEMRARDTGPRDTEHPIALVEADQLAGQVPRQKPGAAGDVERADGRKRGDESLQRVQLVLPAGPVAVRVQTLAEPPVVVLLRAPVVVDPHGS